MSKLEQSIPNRPTEQLDQGAQFLKSMEGKLIHSLGPTERTFAELVRDPKSIDELIRRQAKIGQKDFVMAVGMIAAAIKKNRDYLGKKIFSKYYLESGEDIFEKALGQLRSWEVKPSNQSKYTPEAWQERVVAAERAHAWLRSFKPKPEQQVVMADDQSEVVQPTPEEIIASPLDFEVLPFPKSGETRDLVDFLREHYGMEIDEARVDFLNGYVKKYNGEFFASKLGGTNKNDQTPIKIPLHQQEEEENELGFRFSYLVAVFDKEEPDQVRKFAVADYIRKNKTIKSETEEQRVAHGALYAFEEEPNSELIWQSVLNKTRKEALALGAWKTKHQGDFVGRLEKFLSQEKTKAVGV